MTAYEDQIDGEAREWIQGEEWSEDVCPRCGGPLIEDNGLQCQHCDWKEEENEIEEDEE